MTLTRLTSACAAAMCAAIFAMPASAATDEGVFVGATLSSARNKGSGDQGSSVGTAVGVVGGYRFSSGWSAELSHVDMGGFLPCFQLFGKVNHCEDVQRTTSVSGVYHANIQTGWEALFRAGLARTHTDVYDKNVQNGLGQSRNQTDGLLGIGLEHQVSRSTTVRAEFQTLTKTKVKLIGIGFNWHL